jgi:hypothetical protein
MAEQYLDGPQVARRLVNERSLRSTHRVRALFTYVEADGTDPFVNQPSVLAGAEMAHIIDAAWEDEIVMRASPAVKPSEQGLAYLRHQFELNRSFGFLLHDGRSSSDCAASDDVTDLHFDYVTAAQFAVDRQIEKCPVAQSSMFIEKEAYCPNVAGF